MKKYMTIAACAALVLSSCTKPSDLMPSAPEEALATFTLSSAETKTAFGARNSDNKYPLVWSAGDEIAVMPKGASAYAQVTVTPSSDGRTAEISATVPQLESYEFMLVSPYAALKTNPNFTNGTFYVEIPATQNSTAAGPDAAAQILYAKTDAVTALPQNLNVSMNHATAYLHIFFTNVSIPAGAAVQSVNITASAGCYLAGRCTFSLADQTFSYVESRVTETVAVNTDSVDEIWCGIMPAALAGKTLSLVINTDKGTLNKDITLPGTIAALNPGDVARFSVNMSGISAEESVEYELVTSADALHFGDSVIIASADEDFALGTTQNDNNRGQAGINRSGNIIANPSASVEIIKLQDGLIPGTYALKATVKEGYLYAAGGFDNGGNYLRTKDELDAAGSWDISFGDFTPGDQESPDATRAIIKARTDYRFLLRYNKGSSLFSSYAGTTSTLPVKLYRLKGAASAESRFNVTNTFGSLEDVTVGSAAQEVEVYVFGNVAWTASVSGSATLDKTSGTGNGIIKLTLPENTGTAAVTYTVTVSTSASVSPASYTLKVVQNAPSTSSIKVGDVLWSESWTGGQANDTPAAYQARSSATTVVYGGGSVVYSHTGGGTKLYMDGLVYLKNGTSPIPDGCNPANLLVAKSGGSWVITGIPCAGVKTAKLTYYSNSIPSAKRKVITDTAGVTMSAYDNDPYTSQWDKTVNVISYDISFAANFTGESFNLTFSNTDSSNIRVTDVKLEVTEVY